ncbi:putative GH43/DUF377 family glycosyl hydrolase [Puniceicoccus vermicola]
MLNQISSPGSCVTKRPHQILVGAEHALFANTKIGSEAPPIKTHAGWLTNFHSMHINPHAELDCGENGHGLKPITAS